MLPEKGFCAKCGKEVHYIKKTVKKPELIRGKEYTFDETKCFCGICGNEINAQELIDINKAEIDGQYRDAEGIVTIEDIERIMKMYDIGKAPLSLVLGFGEITIGRYLSGQIPSIEYSNILRDVMTSYEKMSALLEENKFKITPAAYKKVYMAICDMKQIFNLVSSDTLEVISYIFKQITDITPLALQKILYYSQALYITKYSEALFQERCEAWIHGPVYPNIYQLFKDFKYNPIDDERFSLIAGIDNHLNQKKQSIIDLVLSAFGIYSGKILETLTHYEDPWLNARSGLDDSTASSNTITLEAMKRYFRLQSQKYDLYSQKGLQEYIADNLRKHEVKAINKQFQNNLDRISDLKKEDVKKILAVIPDSVDELWVFGSSITPYCRPQSDLDLCIIGHTTIEEETKIFKAPKSSVDIITETPEGFAKESKKPGSVYKEVKEKGVLIYKKGEEI